MKARLYTHLATAPSCEARGCRIPRRLCALRPAAGGYVVACTARHAEEAARQRQAADQRRR
jgi:hypothetical protein